MASGPTCRDNWRPLVSAGLTVTFSQPPLRLPARSPPWQWWLVHSLPWPFWLVRSPLFPFWLVCSMPWPYWLVCSPPPPGHSDCFFHLSGHSEWFLICSSVPPSQCWWHVTCLLPTITSVLNPSCWEYPEEFSYHPGELPFPLSLFIFSSDYPRGFSEISVGLLGFFFGLEGLLLGLGVKTERLWTLPGNPLL